MLYTFWLDSVLLRDQSERTVWDMVSIIRIILYTRGQQTFLERAR